MDRKTVVRSLPRLGAEVNDVRTPRPQRTIGMVWCATNPLAEELQQVAEIVRTAGLGVGRE